MEQSIYLTEETRQKITNFSLVAPIAFSFLSSQVQQMYIDFMDSLREYQVSLFQGILEIPTGTEFCLFIRDETNELPRGYYHLWVAVRIGIKIVRKRGHNHIRYVWQILGCTQNSFKTPLRLPRHFVEHDPETYTNQVYDIIRDRFAPV